MKCDCIEGLSVCVGKLCVTHFRVLEVVKLCFVCGGGGVAEKKFKVSFFCV